MVTRYYAAADADEFAALAADVQRRIASGEEPWPDLPKDAGTVEDLPLFSRSPVDFVPHHERNFPGLGSSQSRVWPRPPEGREWNVEVRPRAPHVSGGKRHPRIVFRRGDLACKTDFRHHRSLAKLSDEQLEELWREARCWDPEDREDEDDDGSVSYFLYGVRDPKSEATS